MKNDPLTIGLIVAAAYLIAAVWVVATVHGGTRRRYPAPPPPSTLPPPAPPRPSISMCLPCAVGNHEQCYDRHPDAGAPECNGCGVCRGLRRAGR